MTNNKRRMWALLALLVIVFGFGYLLRYDPWGWQVKPETAVTESTVDSGTDETTNTETAETAETTETAVEAAPAETGGEAEMAADSQAGVEEQPAVAAAGTEQAAEEQVIPSFGLLRVEPDGSTVIAGSATPGSQLEIVSGDEVLATVTTGETGDFAAVFDEPLPPGDHNIVLQTRNADDTVSQSEEVATVSVPKDDPTKLLVIVTKPGEPSRLLTQPAATVAEAADTTKPAETGDSVAAEKEATETPDADAKDVAMAETEDQPDEDASGVSPTGSDDGAMTNKDALADASETEPAVTKPESVTSDAEPVTSEPETASSEPDMAAGEDEAPPAEAADTAMTAGTGSASEDAAEKVAETDASTKPAMEEVEKTAEVEPAIEESKPESAAVESTEAMAGEKVAGGKDARPAAPADVKLRIDAVEIEGGKLFVAGSATAGGRVAVFADNEPVGGSTVSGSGRFLVEADRDIPVGDHTISADLRMPGEDAVALRVAVPFNRPEGNLVAAVASEPDTDKDTGQAAVSPAASESDAAQAAKDEEPGKPAGSDDMAAVETADGEAATGGSVAEEKTEMAAIKVKPSGAETMVESAPAGGDQKVSEEPQKPEMKEATGTEPDSAAEKTASAVETPEPAEAVMAEKPANVADEEEKPVETAAADIEAKTEPAADGSEPPTIVQPALEQRDSSVIIRRGDTLWQISRRIYGRGVRYTTIYLANTDQIKNPDFIEPGQTFMIPDAPLDNAEELHRQRIRGK